MPGDLAVAVAALAGRAWKALAFIHHHGVLPWMLGAAPGRHAAGRTGLVPYQRTRPRLIRRGDNLYRPATVYRLAGLVPL